VRGTCLTPCWNGGASHAAQCLCVCRTGLNAWRDKSAIQVGGAAGSGKRKGVTARWGLKAAWSEGAGRGTRT
jgi:hypothetical protein